MVAGLQSTSRCLDGPDVPPVSSPGTRRCGRTGSVVPTALSTAAAAMAAGFVVPSWSRWINPVNLSVRQSLFLLASFVPHTHTFVFLSNLSGTCGKIMFSVHGGCVTASCVAARVFFSSRNAFPPKPIVGDPNRQNFDGISK